LALYGGPVVIEPELNMCYGPLNYIFIKGIAGIFAKRLMLAKPLSPKHHLLFGEDGRFCKKQ